MKSEAHIGHVLAVEELKDAMAFVFKRGEGWGRIVGRKGAAKKNIVHLDGMPGCLGFAARGGTQGPFSTCGYNSVEALGRLMHDPISDRPISPRKGLKLYDLTSVTSRGLRR